MPQVIPGHSIATVSEFKSRLFATAGGTGGLTSAPQNSCSQEQQNIVGTAKILGRLSLSRQALDYGMDSQATHSHSITTRDGRPKPTAIEWTSASITIPRWRKGDAVWFELEVGASSATTKVERRYSELHQLRTVLSKELKASGSLPRSALFMHEQFPSKRLALFGPFCPHSVPGLPHVMLIPVELRAPIPTRITTSS